MLLILHIVVADHTGHAVSSVGVPAVALDGARMLHPWTSRRPSATEQLLDALFMCCCTLRGLTTSLVAISSLLRLPATRALTSRSRAVRLRRGTTARGVRSGR